MSEPRQINSAFSLPNHQANNISKLSNFQIIKLKKGASPLFLLSLCKAISFFLAPGIEEFKRTYFEIAAQAYIQANDVLLVEG